MAKTVVYLYTESPLHAGTGSGLGTVDLPIQRERHTDLPLVQGSSIKGTLRALASAPLFDGSLAEDEKGPYARKVQAVFGPETESASEYASAVTVGDARLLLFPVRSLRGVFVWATAPLVLQRLHRDLKLLTGSTPEWTPPDLSDDSSATNATALVPTTSAAIVGDGGAAVVLEEYTFVARPDAGITAIADWLGDQLTGLDPWWSARLHSHFVILPDTAFRDFVLYSTEVVTRVRLSATKTVEAGALWTEECLPTDSLLYSPVLARTPSQKDPAITSDTAALSFVREHAQQVFQLGGDETVGRGLVRPLWSAAEGVL